MDRVKKRRKRRSQLSLYVSRNRKRAKHSKKPSKLDSPGSENNYPMEKELFQLDSPPPPELPKNTLLCDNTNVSFACVASEITPNGPTCLFQTPSTSQHQMTNKPTLGSDLPSPGYHKTSTPIRTSRVQVTTLSDTNSQSPGTSLDSSALTSPVQEISQDSSFLASNRDTTLLTTKTTSLTTTPFNSITSSRKRKAMHMHSKKSRQPRKKIRLSLFSSTSYKDQCAREICGMSTTLVEIMKEADLLHDFMVLLRALSKKSLDTANIAFLLCLERAKFGYTENTSNMTYYPSTLKFWKVVYRLAKGKAIRLFSGPKYSGQLYSAPRGYFNPDTAHCNFAVPSVKILRTNADANPVPKEIAPGIIEDVVTLVGKNASKDYVIAIDGKKVAQGLDANYGDINLWGHEEPSIASALERLSMEKELLQTLVDNEPDLEPECTLESLPSECAQKIQYKLTKVATAASKRIQDIRELNLRQNFLMTKLLKLQENNQDVKDKYSLAIANTKATMYRCRAAIGKGLTLTDSACALGSQLGEAAHAYIPGLCMDINTQENIVQLKNPDELPAELRYDCQYIKQRSAEWFEIRKSAPVTGSTMHTALGLRRRKDQKEHVQVYRGDKLPTPHTPELQVLLQHGQDNEENAIATFSGKVIPFLYPNQYLVEEGCRLVPGREGGRPLLEVSCDGTLRNKDMTVTSILEIKCPMEQSHKVPVHYVLPKYYICQVLSEMHALGVEKGIFLSYSRESMSVLEVTFDPELWGVLHKEVKDLYGKEDIIVPKKLRASLPGIKEMMTRFVEQNVTLVLEVPAMTTSSTGVLQSTPDSPFMWPLTPHHGSFQVHKMDEFNIFKQKAEEFFNEADILCRRKASELLAFVITDTDRISHPELLHHMPIAYAMKGYSLTCGVLRQMCETLKQHCHNQGINVVCESFDGQWHYLCVRDINGLPLNRLELQKDVWKEVQSMSKGQQVTFMKRLYHQPAADSMWIKNGGAITISSIDGMLQSVVTPKDPRLWAKPKSLGQPAQPCVVVQSHELDDACISGAEELSMIHTADQTEVTVTEPGTEVESEDNESSPIAPTDEELLDILSSLRDTSAVRWVNTTVDQLRGRLTYSGLMKLYRKEIHTIMQCLSHHVGMPQFVPKHSKAQNASSLATALGDTHDVTVSHASHASHRRRTVPRLDVLCGKALMAKSYPKAVLNVALAKYIYPQREKEWEENSPVPMETTLGDTSIRMFSHPEISRERNRIEPRVIDPSHLLVNNRTRILSRGINGVSPKAFLRVCDTNPDVINRSLVVDIIDKQSVAYAQKVFSAAVEDVLRSNGDTAEANYTHLVRGWYDAIDNPGIPAEKRIEQMVAFREYLLQDVDFASFPPPGLYVKGMSIVQFCGFVQNVGTRLQLYKLCKSGTYNHRAIGTLAVESFFGELSDMVSNGCPKSVKIPQMMAHVTEMNNFRHDSTNRPFYMATKRTNVYPTKPLDGTACQMNEYTLNDSLPSNIFITDHFFDMKERAHHQRRRKSHTISKPHETRKGTLPVRSLRFKKDESKISDIVKLGLTDDDLS